MPICFSFRQNPGNTMMPPPYRGLKISRYKSRRPPHPRQVRHRGLYSKDWPENNRMDYIASGGSGQWCSIENFQCTLTFVRRSETIYLDAPVFPASSRTIDSFVSLKNRGKMHHFKGEANLLPRKMPRCLPSKRGIIRDEQKDALGYVAL